VTISPPLVPYLESTAKPVNGTPVLLGVPFDGTACFRKGAARGPDSIREASDCLESYSPFLHRDLSLRPFSDLGNLILAGENAEKVNTLVKEASLHLLSKKLIPFLIGGEHSFTPGAVAAVLEHHPGLAVVQFDAHADLRNEWTNTQWSHACCMRRIRDMIPPSRILQCGIRSGSSTEFDDLRESGCLVPPDIDSLTSALEKVEGLPLYLTLDLDFLDPADLPGTGTPEPGGVNWQELEELLAALPWHRVVACDVVELAPELDPTGRSSILAAKIIREILLSLP
tara:strand:- start:69 stop:920 length:852 start_codon:yes stop_codon:yes gene_type:complete